MSGFQEDDLERRLRAALHLKASQVTPDPRTWQRVVDRAQRGRRRALVLSGAVSLAVVVVVALVALDVARLRGTVEFPAADRGPDQATLTALPPAGPCGQAPLVVVLRTGAGALQASCADGTTVELEAEGSDVDAPALSADGGALAFQHGPGSASEVVVRDLGTGAQRVLGEGTQPAFAPDGRLAHVAPSGDPRDPAAPRIVVTTPDGEQVRDFPAADDAGAKGAEVVDLAWTPDGRLLTYGLVSGDADRSDVVADPASGAVAPLMAHEHALGGEHSGSAPIGSLQLVTLSRCCPALGGDVIQRVQLGVAGYRGDPGGSYQGPQFRALVDLGDLRGFAPDRPGRAYLVRPVGRVRADAVERGLRWQQGDAEAFLVGDGSALWLVATDGDATFLADDVTAAAVNPSAFGAADIDGAALLSQRRQPVPARPNETDVQVWFAQAGAEECAATRSVTRSVPLPRTAEGALRALLGGPTMDERAAGATSAFSERTADLLRDLRLMEDGTLVVDLDDPREVLPRPASRCEAIALRAQLDRTLLQFANVRAVRYLVAGDADDFDAFLTPPAPRPSPTPTPTTPTGPSETSTVTLPD